MKGACVTEEFLLNGAGEASRPVVTWLSIFDKFLYADIISIKVAGGQFTYRVSSHLLSDTYPDIPGKYQKGSRKCEITHLECYILTLRVSQFVQDPVRENRQFLPKYRKSLYRSTKGQVDMIFGHIYLSFVEWFTNHPRYPKAKSINRRLKQLVVI